MLMPHSLHMLWLLDLGDTGIASSADEEAPTQVPRTHLRNILALSVCVVPDWKDHCIEIS